MKAWILAGILSLGFASSALAHCGSCGVEGDHSKKGGEVHAGAHCPMHGEKNAVLNEAAAALEASNPELASKLKDIATNCCGGHS